MDTKKDQNKNFMEIGSTELQELIDQAMRKIGSKQEKELCKYIPGDKGGYMHHFTMKKMRSKSQEELSSMLKEYILETETPKKIAPRQRAARGSRKKQDQIILTQDDIDRILNIAKTVGDEEVVRKLMPKKNLKSIQRELIRSIQRGKVEQDLWRSYTQAALYAQETGCSI